MKKLILLVFLSIGMMLGTQAQTRVTVDNNGNYYPIKSDSSKSTGEPTGKYYQDAKGNKFPVFVSKNGKLFYHKTSKKTGLNYNAYLSKE